MRGYAAHLSVGNAANLYDEMQVPDSAAIRARDTMSLELWTWSVRRYAVGFSKILTKYDNVDNGYHIFTDSTRKDIFRFGVKRGGTVYEKSVYGQLGQWNHWVMNFELATPEVYLNGRIATTGTGSYLASPANYTTDLMVGGDRPGFSNNQFEGRVSCLALRSIALTADQVAALYHEGVEPGGRLAGWVMDEGFGGDVADTEGANPATVGNPTWLPMGPP